MRSTVRSVIAALLRFEDDAAVQEQACAALSNLGVFLGDRNCVKDEFSNLESPAVLSALLVHGEVAEVQQQACRVLSLVCHHHEKNQSIAGEAPGLVQAVVNALDLHSGDALVQQHACAAIASLCSRSVQPCTRGPGSPYFFSTQARGVLASDENRDRAIRAGAPEAAMDAILAFEDDQEVRKHGVLALRNLGAKAVAGLMAGGRKCDARVQEVGLAAFIAMCVCDDSGADPDAPGHAICCKEYWRSCDAKLVEDAVDANAVELTLVALKEHARNPSVQEKGCQALWIMLRHYEKVGDQDCFAEAWVAVLAAMHAFASNPGVQEHGCAALSATFPSLSDDDYDSIARSVEGQRLPGVARAIEAVVGAMKVHPSSAEVQKRGRNALIEFCTSRSRDGPTARAEHRDLVIRRVGEAGGLEAIVEALRNHATAADADAQCSGCEALSSLLTDPENCRRVREAGGALETVVGVLKASARMVTGLHKEAEKAKFNGIRGKKEKEKEKELHLDKMSEQRSVLTAVCEVLAILCVDAESRRRAGDAGAIEGIVEASKVLQTERPSRVFRGGFQTLSCLCADDDNRRLARQCGALEVVVKAINAVESGLDNFHGQPNYGLFESGCEVICAICPHGEIHDGAAEQDAVRAVVKILEKLATIGVWSRKRRLDR